MRRILGTILLSAATLVGTWALATAIGFFQGQVYVVGSKRTLVDFRGGGPDPNTRTTEYWSGLVLPWMEVVHIHNAARGQNEVRLVGENKGVPAATCLLFWTAPLVFWVAAIQGFSLAPNTALWRPLSAILLRVACVSAAAGAGGLFAAGLLIYRPGRVGQLSASWARYAAFTWLGIALAGILALLAVYLFHRLSKAERRASNIAHDDIGSPGFLTAEDAEHAERLGQVADRATPEGIRPGPPAS